jgi:hypothetical protein
MAPTQLELPGDGEFKLAIVGESHYQAALEKVCGPHDKAADERGLGVFVEEPARLILDDSNPYDQNAVRVELRGEPVGYLSRGDAKAYRQYLQRQGAPTVVGLCMAQIRGGFPLDEGGRAPFGVRLDFILYG